MCVNDVCAIKSNCFQNHSFWEGHIFILLPTWHQVGVEMEKKKSFSAFQSAACCSEYPTCASL